MADQQRPAFNICIFCGSRAGTQPEYLAAAQQLGTALAQRGIGIVYGGSSMGLMGAVADSCLAAGGYVEGVIPDALFLKEVAHPRLSERFVVKSMHARKAMMAERANGFIALPGGLGTLEELFEIITWAQLGIHAKPIVVWNVVGYYDALLHFVEHSVAQGFVSAAHRNFVAIRNDLDAVLDDLRSFKAPTSIAKWLDRDET